ncbi:MAG: F0F1 ATP synthase subunit B [Thermomicrobiales bacterium]|nr:F0F1 ATP synthase subunit B [Thermomicrobiales bacterium]
MLESFGVDLTKLLVQIIAFLAFLFLLWRYASGPIVKILDERQEKVREGMEAASRMQSQLEATAARNEEVLAEARREAQSILAQSRESGDALVERAREEAGKQSDEYMARAQAAIRAETEQARQELRKEAADLAVLVASKIVRKELDPATQASLIEATLSEAIAGQGGAADKS